MISQEQLARTLALFQTDLGLDDPQMVLQALSETSITLVADSDVIGSFAGQVAVSTSAMLMARSGHSVFIDVPDSPLMGYQPPMTGRTFYEGINSVSDKLIDGVKIKIGAPTKASDILFVFGNASRESTTGSGRVVSVGWGNWYAELCDFPTKSKQTVRDWPIGAMTAAALVAAEAAKVTGRRLARFSSNSAHFQELFAPSPIAQLALASESTPRVSDVGNFDIISAGAVCNAFLYALLRVPSVVGRARVFDGDKSDDTNRNRNMLLLPQFVRKAKVDVFCHNSSGLVAEPVPRHFTEADVSTLAGRVVVGVDDM